MVTVDASKRIRISSRATRQAGFIPGQRLAVVPVEGFNTSFRIVSASRISKKILSARYSVEKDGRIRVAETAVNSLGVRRSKSKRKNSLSVTATRGSITVSM